MRTTEVDAFVKWSENNIIFPKNSYSFPMMFHTNQLGSKNNNNINNNMWPPPTTTPLPMWATTKPNLSDFRIDVITWANKQMVITKPPLRKKEPQLIDVYFVNWIKCGIVDLKYDMTNKHYWSHLSLFHLTLHPNEFVAYQNRDIWKSHRTLVKKLYSNICIQWLTGSSINDVALKYGVGQNICDASK